MFQSKGYLLLYKDGTFSALTSIQGTYSTYIVAGAESSLDDDITTVFFFFFLIKRISKTLGSCLYVVGGFELFFLSFSLSLFLGGFLSFALSLGFLGSTLIRIME